MISFIFLCYNKHNRSYFLVSIENEKLYKIVRTSTQKNNAGLLYIPYILDEEKYIRRREILKWSNIMLRK